MSCNTVTLLSPDQTFTEIATTCARSTMPYYQWYGKTRNCFEALQSLQAIKLTITWQNVILFYTKQSLNPSHKKDGSVVWQLSHEAARMGQLGRKRRAYLGMKLKQQPYRLNTMSQSAFSQQHFLEIKY